MENDDIDGIFKDFEHKVTDKNETDDSAEKITEDGLLKRRYQKAEEALKEEYRKEREALERKKEEEPPKHKNIPIKSFGNIERITYIGIILLFVAYIAVDISLFHGEKNIGVGYDQAIAAAAVADVARETNKTIEIKEEKTIEEKKEPVKEEVAVQEEKKLSGEITLTIDKIYRAVDDKDNDLGYISKIVFTIDNGKDKVLTPIVDVYAYDSKLDESWETRSRGQYIYKIGINPGAKHTGSIDLVPKTFRNLDLKKDIRLTLNDTKEGYISAVNEQVLIS